jgi:hypothetical protein
VVRRHGGTPSEAVTKRTKLLSGHWAQPRHFRFVPLTEVAERQTHDASASSKALASFRSGVPKPSVNQP